MGELGFTVTGGMLVGYGIGYGIDVLASTRIWRTVGLFFGLASGLWAAARILIRMASEGKRGDSHT
ncbi:AtpZ/AtpI family protein [Candidatus Bipolaricaulota bacterium]|nr:AtpZ/AtpI family protein [Candidatus Bipolaricaulota bacterium]